MKEANKMENLRLSGCLLASFECIFLLTQYQTVLILGKFC
jgi:hypothetical protein